MITYECETCGCTTEIEEIEVLRQTSYAERYDFDQCVACFAKDTAE